MALTMRGRHALVRMEGKDLPQDGHEIARILAEQLEPWDMELEMSILRAQLSVAEIAINQGDYELLDKIMSYKTRGTK